MSPPTQGQFLRLHAPPEGSPRGTRGTAKVETLPLTPPSKDKDLVLFKVLAAGFNRRDEWSMQGAYPGLTYPSTLGCDACGFVVGEEKQRYLVVPTRGWSKDTRGPEADVPGSDGQKAGNALGGKGFGLLGGTRQTGGVGCFAEYMTVERSQLVPVPDHLSDEEAAALPCAAVTAYRALFTKARVEPGHNVLITGIGGGVALLALRLALARGANVYVTGGSQPKLDHALKVGAKAGAIYKDAKAWPEAIKQSLPKDRPYLDAVIDSAGGAICAQALKAGLRPGGSVVVFGMTATPKVDFTMREVLQNVDLCGSTMGSEEEFRRCIRFIGEKGVKPDVDTVLWGGLEEARDKGFEMLADAEKRARGGKVVCRVAPKEEGKSGGPEESKL
ncbi:NAD(P)-binding protein [Jaminaea rosea]|uniref:NAD(P)-binding protein n=1 Tax=Jaminaea rosea TaxID=1569628 RepID=A0A316UMF5_9BASI|nr:NAD(P)-binding protein [Jaminaea rosea]PWN26476.1 NAD(P)-binding protein [Jaminaea rosea]